MEPTIRILALCDSPTLNSGFACVARNLFSRWSKNPAVSIDIYGIGFTGWDYDRFPNWRLIPAGVGGEWHHRLDYFIRQISAGGYTHVFILQDIDILSQNNFPRKLREVCSAKNIRSMVYFPVDAPTQPSWTNILSSVDAAVAYTHYGKREVEAKAKIANLRINASVLPHGVDTGLFKFIPKLSDGTHVRNYFKLGVNKDSFVPFLKEGDFCLINVSTNQWRKDPLRSLEILVGLIAAGVPAKMVMHMPEKPGSGSGGTDLISAANQLGLELGKDWMHTGPLFNLPMNFGLSQLSEDHMPRIYSAADMLITTTLGEGWGLPITEALACGLPVAIPMHTACEEIQREISARGMSSRTVPMPLEDGHVMGDGSLRRRVALGESVEIIKSFYESGEWKEKQCLTDSAQDFLSWDRIANKMLTTLVGKPPAKKKK